MILSSKTFILDKNKFLVSNNNTLASFVTYLRKYLSIPHESFLIHTYLKMEDIKKQYADDEGIVYLFIEKDIDFFLQVKWFFNGLWKKVRI